MPPAPSATKTFACTPPPRAAAYRANLATAWHPDDSQAVITVPARNAVVILTAYIDPARGDGPQFALGGTPAQVAARVHGTVIPPAS